MRYKRSAVNIVGLILLAVLAGLITPYAALAAPTARLVVPTNWRLATGAHTKKVAVVYYNDSASPMTVSTVTVNNGAAISWGTVNGTAGTYGPVLPTVATAVLTWNYATAVPAYSTKTFFCEVTTTAGATAGNYNWVATVNDGGANPTSTISHNYSSRTYSTAAYAYMGTAASPVYSLGEGTPITGGVQQAFTVEFRMPKGTIADLGNTDELDTSQGGTVPTQGWAKVLTVDIPAGWTTPTPAASQGIWSSIAVTNGGVGPCQISASVGTVAGNSVFGAAAATCGDFVTTFTFNATPPSGLPNVTAYPIQLNLGDTNHANLIENRATKSAACVLANAGTLRSACDLQAGFMAVVAAGASPATTTGALTATTTADTSIAVQATYTGDTNDTNTCVIQYKQNGSPTWLELTEAADRPGKKWTATASGLLPGTSYNFQATFSDGDTVTGTNPITLTTPTTHIGTTAGSMSTTSVLDTSVSLSMSFTGDTNANNTSLFEYKLASEPTVWTNAGAGTRGAAAHTKTIPGLIAGTAYNFRCTLSDANSVYGTATDSVNTTTTALGTTVGALTSTATLSTSVALSAAFAGDTNANDSVTFEYKESSSGTWLAGPAGSLGTGEWTVTVSGLLPVTSYDFRATFSDANGVYGTNPSTYTTSTIVACDSVVNDCMDCHAMPPSAGSHNIVAHQGDSSRTACAVCHFDYTGMVNVTSTANWTTGHANDIMNIYTSNNVNGGMKGGYYSGYRNASTIWDGKTPNANNTCSATYCHGSGASPAWGATGTLTCASCHNNPPTDVGSHAKHSQGYRGYKNNSNAANYDFGCYRCHPEGTHAAGPASANASAFVAFSNLSSPVAMGGTYTVGVSQGNDNKGFEWSNATCTAALYCHSDGRGGAAPTVATWGTTIATCTACHGGKTTLTSNSHGAHLNQGNLGVFGCVDCHNTTVSGDTTVNNKANHVDGVKTVAMTSGTYSSGTCGTNYCHSSGQATPVYRTSPNWSGGTLDCDGCHGTEGVTLVAGAPEYTNTGPTPNSHANHVSAATDCINCHNTTVDAAGAIKAASLHLDGARNVAFSGGGTWNGTTCSGTAAACHQGTTPTWGGTLLCSDCHMDAGAIGVETDDYTYGNATKATINTLEWTNAGHGRTTAYPLTANAGANLTCASCHDSAVPHNTGTNPFRILGYTTPDALCLGCHDGTPAKAVAAHDLAHVGQGTWTWTPKCIDCHDPHGDNGGITTAQYNRAMVQSSVAIADTGTHGVPGSTNTVDYPIGFGASRTWAGFVDATSPYNGICQVCHTTSLYFTQSLYTAGHNNTQPCTDCHSHTGGFAPAGSCIDCHKTGGAGTLAGKRDMQIEFGKNSHHINAAFLSVDPISCTACHVEGNFADGTIVSAKHKDAIVQLKQWTGAFPLAGNNGTFTEVAYSTEASMNPVCLGCHNATNAAAQPFASSADTATPGTYDVASGGTGAGSIAERYSAAGTTPFSKFDPNRFNVVPQITKAYSPHGNATGNQRGVVTAEATAWANDGGTTNVACLDCHNSHASNIGSGTTSTSYTSSVGAYGAGILKSTATYTPAAGGSAGTKNVYAASSDLCFDCHLGDDATAPKDYNTGFNNTAAIKGYYDPGRWSTADVWTPTYAYKTAGAGNGAGTQKGGHFGASSALVETPAPSGNNLISGRCTVCHDPHGVNPAKTGAAYMVPALKGGWLTSPYKEDRAPSLSAIDDLSTYGNYWTGDTNVGAANRYPSRFTPRFDYCNPSGIGNGYGRGIVGTTYGYGGTGAYGYFIDDNTFGTSVTNNNAGTGIVDNNTSRVNNATAQRINSGLTGMPAAADMVPGTFAGLCLTCHTQAALEGVNYNMGTGGPATNIYPHNTVSGWASTLRDSDLFTGSDTNGHQMAYTGKNSTRIDCSMPDDSSSPQILPAGYKWSVNPGPGRAVTSTAMTSATPAAQASGQLVAGGLIQTGFHQFTCSKCHTAHTSKLPRLMKTNCLDVGTSTTTPKHQGPVTYTYPLCDTGGGSRSNMTYMMQCHNMKNSNTLNGGGWNIKTGW